MKKLFLCSVSKPRVGPINSFYFLSFTFKCGNIFAGICTLVLSLCWRHKSRHLQSSHEIIVQATEVAIDIISSNGLINGTYHLPYSAWLVNVRGCCLFTWPHCLVIQPALSAQLPCQPTCLVSPPALSAHLPCQPTTIFKRVGQSADVYTKLTTALMRGSEGMVY